MLDVVLKWSYWDEQDRKDNYVTLVPLSKYWEYLLDKPYPVSGELRFADSKSRFFKPYTFQFLQGKLTCFKDKSVSYLYLVNYIIKVIEFKVEDTINVLFLSC